VLFTITFYHKSCVYLFRFSSLPEGAAGLTEGVVQLSDGEGEAAVGASDAKEDHGHVLRGAAGGPPRCGGGAVVRVALV